MSDPFRDSEASALARSEKLEEENDELRAEIEALKREKEERLEEAEAEDREREQPKAIPEIPLDESDKRLKVMVGIVVVVLVLLYLLVMFSVPQKPR